VQATGRSIVSGLLPLRFILLFKMSILLDKFLSRVRQFLPLKCELLTL